MTAPDEAKRIASVRRYNVLDTPPDEAFERITSLAARFFNVPVALVSIVDEQRIWFKSHHGINLQQVKREPGLCASAVLQNEVYAVLDTKLDPRTQAHSLVTGEFGLRFYAAAPLRTRDGFNIGTVCVIDYHPHIVTESQKETLVDLAVISMTQLELQLAARTDVSIQIPSQTQTFTRTKTLIHDDSCDTQNEGINSADRRQNPVSTLQPQDSLETLDNGSPQANNPIDYQILQSFYKTVVGQNTFNMVVQLIECYLEEANKLLQMIETGLSQGDMTQLKQASHTLKASSAALGAITLAHLCKELETMSRLEKLGGAFEKVLHIQAEFEKVKEALQMEAKRNQV